MSVSRERTRGRVARRVESKCYRGLQLKCCTDLKEIIPCAKSRADRTAGIVWRLGEALALVAGLYRKMILLLRANLSLYPHKIYCAAFLC